MLSIRQPISSRTSRRVVNINDSNLGRSKIRKHEVSAQRTLTHAHIGDFHPSACFLHLFCFRSVERNQSYLIFVLLSRTTNCQDPSHTLCCYSRSDFYASQVINGISACIYEAHISISGCLCCRPRRVAGVSLKSKVMGCLDPMGIKECLFSLLSWLDNTIILI